MSKKMTAFGSKFIQTSKAISKKRQKLAEAVAWRPHPLWL